MGRIILFQGDPPGGGIPANRIVSVPPALQNNGRYDGGPFLMAGFDQNRGVTFEQNGGKANVWYQVAQPAGTRPGFDWKGAAGYVIQSNLGPTRPTTALYGVEGTPEAGVLYDQNTKQFYKDVPDIDYGTTGGATTDPYGGGPTTTASKPRTRGYDLAISRDGRIWFASAANESKSQDGPHPGISLAGPETWNTQEWGTPASQGMHPRAYVIAMDDPGDKGTIRPAKQEFKRLWQMAINGNESAQEVMDILGVEPPEMSLSGKIRSGIGGLF